MGLSIVSFSAFEETLQHFRPLLSILLGANSQEYFADLRNASSFPVRNLLKVSLELGGNAEGKWRVLYWGHGRTL
jgi:hypothetical protein